MKNIMIFGAGQAGCMIYNWLSSKYNLLGFLDNNPLIWGKTIEGNKIFSPKDIVNINPDVILITVLNKEASKQIELQLEDMDYKGEIFNINNFRNDIDIRLASLRLISKEINEKDLDGEVGELGVYQGKFACEINKLFPNKKIYLFDTFEGFYNEDIDIERYNNYSRAEVGDFSDTNIDIVKSKLPYKDSAIFYKGYFPQSVKDELPMFCLVSIDTDLYEPTYQGLVKFYPKLVKGGMILIHDYNSKQFPGVKQAVKRFCEEEGVFVVPLCDMHGSAVLVK